MSGSTTWERVTAALVSHGVDTVFGLPGDDMAILGALDAGGIRVSLVRDQRHALYRAIGHGRISGRPSVCFVGKGPALTHAATGLLEARAMRHPLLLLTSGVPLARMGTGAFQELDAIAAFPSLTVGAIRLDERTLSTGIAEAFRLSTRQGRGPVIVEVPEGMVSAEEQREPLRVPPRHRGQRAVPLPPALREARRPLVLVGGGCGDPGTAEGILALTERLGAAVMVTASGRGLFDETHSAFLGVSGLYLPARARETLGRADVILALGTRLEETATFGWDAELAPECQIVHVLDDGNEFVAGRETTRIVADVGEAVRAWHAVLPGELGDRGWAGAVARTHAALIDDDPLPVTTSEATPRVADVLREVDATLPPARVSVHENGLQDMWSYVFPRWIVRGEAACLAPSEQTPLGFGMAAAPAVAAADSRPVVVIGGDGAFCAVGADLAGFGAVTTPLLVVVLSNGGFGWLEANRRRAVAPFSFLDGRPVIAGLCAAYGLDHVGCIDAAQLGAAVRRAWRRAETGRTVVLEVEVALDDVPPGFEELAGDFPERVPVGGDAR